MWPAKTSGLMYQLINAFFSQLDVHIDTTNILYRDIKGDWRLATQ
jgi:hypothetical protein